MKWHTTPVDDDHFQAKIMVCTSPTFYRWVFGFGGSIKILGPETVKSKYINMLKDAMVD